MGIAIAIGAVRVLVAAVPVSLVVRDVRRLHRGHKGLADKPGDAAGVSAAGVSAAGVSAAGVSAAGVSAAGMTVIDANALH